MRGKTTSKKLNFDDSNLPVNNLTPKRISHIEKIAMPLLSGMIEKLRAEQPELFRNNSGKKK